MNSAELGISTRCCTICSDSLVPAGAITELLAPDRLCGQRGCVSAFCRACLGTYYTLAAEASRYAVPFMRCPGCRGYIRSRSWWPLIAEELREEMNANAEHLLALRCVECDEPGSLLVSGGLTAKQRE